MAVVAVVAAVCAPSQLCVTKKVVEEKDSCVRIMQGITRACNRHGTYLTALRPLLAACWIALRVLPASDMPKGGEDAAGTACPPCTDCCVGW